MAKIADFFVELGLKKDKFDAGLKEAEKAPSRLNESFKNLAVGIASAFSVTAIIAFGKASMQAYDQQAKAEAGLLQALNGRKDILDELILQSSELQGKTLFGDEETLAAQKQLAVMGLTKDQIKSLIPLIQDYATVSGQDLSSAAMLVAKSIATSTNALARYGVEIDSSMSRAEKAAEVQRIFNERYGGQAEAAAKVGTGAIKQAGMAFGDLTEVVGKLLSTNTSGFFSSLTGTLQDITNVLNSESIPAWRKFYGLINVGVGGANILEAEAFAKWKENRDKEKNARLANIDLIRQQTDETIQNIEALKQQNQTNLDALKIKNDERLKAEALAAKQAADAYQSYVSGVEKAVSASIDLSNIGNVGENLFGKIDPSNIDVEEIDIQPLEIPVNVKKFNEDLIATKEAWTNFTTSLGSSINDFLAGAISELFTGIGEALTGGQDLDSVFLNILGGFGKFLSQMGAMMISYGIAEMAFFTSFAEGPFGAAKLIAAGAALALIGGAISGLASQASKGINSSGTAGVGGGAQSSLDYIMNGANQQTLSASIKGSDLVFVLEREQRNKRGV